MATYAAAEVLLAPEATELPLDEPPPPSFTVVLTQVISLPLWMVTISEYAVAPVLSLRAMLLHSHELWVPKIEIHSTHKMVLAWRSTNQV